VPSHRQLATIVSFAPRRLRALLTLDRLLAETRVAPVSSNLEQLRAILNHEAFRAGQYDTGLVRTTLSLGA
jgi:acetyl/propionyl-CoA carboxylase alpha subunit